MSLYIAVAACKSGTAIATWLSFPRAHTWKEGLTIHQLKKKLETLFTVQNLQLQHTEAGAELNAFPFVRKEKPNALPARVETLRSAENISERLNIT